MLPETLTHHVLRGKFRPDGTLGESDFYVYSVHLKSGSTGSDATQRGVEAGLLRDDVDALGEGANVLMVGDFNMQGSSEVAFTQLVAAGTGQLFDVAGAPGEWNDNPSFKSLHKQDPGASMDDRFDLQFASGELFDDMGLEYVDSSFHVFGNDGSHTLNDLITTGTGASPAVLSALVNASDHLPIVADYEVIPSTPFVRIRETGGQTKAVEGGVFDTYSVVLDTVPTDNVTVTVTPDAQLDLGSGAGVSVQLVFTPTNALTQQNIIVTANDDVANEGNHSGLVTHSSSSVDLDYDSLAIANVDVALIDNDDPVIVINEIDSDTQSVDMLEFVELYDGGVGNVSLDGKTLVFFNGNGDTAYRVIDLTGSSTDANGFFVAGNTGIASSDVTFANNGLQNGPDAVALYVGTFATNDPVTTTNLLDAIVYDTDDADDAGLLVLLEAGQPQVNEDENNNKDFDALARVPDHGTQRETITFVAQAPTPDALNDPPNPGVLFAQSGTRVDVEEGGQTDSYQISLDTFPTGDVMITVDPDDQVSLGAGAGVAIVLTFTSANAIIPQTVTVTAVNDFILEGDHVSVITHTAASSDPSYNGLPINNVVANVIDNDVALPPSIVISEIMYDPDTSEGGPGLPEWIEIVNTGSQSVDLEGWFFQDEDEAWGAFPAGTTLDPGQLAVFFDSSFTTEATFRSEWSVPANALVKGIDWASLANSPNEFNEILELKDALGTQMDLANYDDTSPWPTNFGGPSIYLLDPVSDNNNGSNWALSVVGVDRAVAASGPTFATTDVGSPGSLPVSADFNFDGQVSGLDFLAWQRGFGTGSPTALKPDGDADSDLDVDSGDLVVWESEYGTVSVPIAAPLAVAVVTEEPVLLATVASESFAFSGSNVILSLPTATKYEPSEPNVEERLAPTLPAEVVDRAFSSEAASSGNSRVREGSSTFVAYDGASEDITDEALDSLDELSTTFGTFLL